MYEIKHLILPPCYANTVSAVYTSTIIFKCIVMNLLLSKQLVFVRIVFFPLSALFFSIIIGCNDYNEIEDNVDNSDTNNSGNSCSAAITQVSIEEMTEKFRGVVRGPERHFHDLSEQIPGYGGSYINRDGEYTVYLKDDSQQANASSVINQNVKAKSLSQDLRFKQADYTFKDLATWRELITAYMLSSAEHDYVLTNHIDESANKIVVGIAEDRFNEQNISDVKAYIDQELNIPVNAISIIKEYPEVEEAESVDNLSGSYQDRQRPLVGGIRLSYGSSSNCSIGFVGKYEGKDVFITNAHCTGTGYTDSFTIYYQGDRNNTNDRIGMEIDGNEATRSACVEVGNLCWPCRWSDSAIAEINDDVPRQLGLIAKTTRESDQFLVDGSMEIDQDDPVFTVVDHEIDIVLGKHVHKVGGNSGWTSGEIIRTCYDSRRSRHEVVLQCQTRARYGSSGGGTSGSPVFKRLQPDQVDDDNITNPVALVGIHRASGSRDSPDGFTAFSPMSGILKDHEKLELKGLEHPADAPLTRSVSE